MKCALDNVTVIIPALNERDSLPLVLRDLPQVGRVIVVNNGSTDDSADIAEAHGASVIDEPRRGYGSACLAGIAAATTQHQAGFPKPSILVFLDADYSDHANLLPELVAPIFAEQADMVLGSRLLGKREPGAMPPQSIYGNKLACCLMRRLFGANYTDLGPFRAIRMTHLEQLKMVDTNYGWTIEMQIKAHRLGLVTQEIPVPYRRRIGTSKISGTVGGTIKAGTKILVTIARYGFINRGKPAITS